jgi:hypothetical protein
MENFTEQEIVETLRELCDVASEEGIGWGEGESDDYAQTYDFSEYKGGLLTYNKGLVIRLPNGQTFEIEVRERR